MSLGRDEGKHILCKYEGSENPCPKGCTKCAVLYLNIADGKGECA